MAFGGLQVITRPRPARRRGRDRQRDRPERRRQDDALQPDHRHLPPGRRRHPASTARASSALAPHEITNRGIARTFQTLRLFLNMTVKENVMAAAYGHTHATIVESMLRLPRARREEKAINALAEEKLSFFGERLMGYRWNQPAYSLSYANRRRLEIARAMAAKPAPAAPRRAGRGDEPGRDARDHRADRPGSARRAATRSSSSSTTCTSSRASPTASSRSTTASRSPRARSSRWRRTSGSSRPTSVSRSDGDEVSENGAPLLELDAVDTYYGPIHILQGLSLVVRSGELVCLLGGNASGQVDDAEDGARHRAAANGRGALRRRGRDRAGRRATGSRRAWRSCPRTGACSGR